jgi:fibronectin-binding autotransporter adhesin
LSVSSLANGGSPSGIGASGNAAENLVINGGTLQYSGSVAGSTDRSFTVDTAGATIDASGTATGSLTITGSPTLVTNAATTTLNLSGTNTDANTFSGTLSSTNAADGLILNKTGAGAWTLGGNDSSTLDKGRLTVSDGTLNFGSATEEPTLTISAQAGADNSGMNVNSGNFIMKAGNLTVNNMAYGLLLNTSTYTQTGGTFSTNAIIGLANYGGSSTVNISGGSFTTTNGGVSATELAVRGTTIFNLSGTGTVTTPTLNMSTSQIGSGAATSTFNLDGGTLVAGKIIKGTGGSTGTQTFNFNGGTLRSSASSTTYMTGLTNAFVKAGGAIIDTQAFNVTIGQNLLTDVVSTGGGLTKSGNGTLTLSATNTYTGATTVTAGTLSLGNGTTNTSLADTAAVVIGTDPTATLNLNYTGTDTVLSLTINGLAKAPGVYSSSEPSGRISGTGTLTVLTGAASPYTTWANSFLPGNDVSNPAGDNDNDGLTNQQEFAFGLSPISGSSVNPILVQLNKTTGQFSYQRRAASGLTYKILTSTTLATGSWTEDATAGQVATAIPSTDNESVVVTLTTPPTAAKFFIRVSAN